MIGVTIRFDTRYAEMDWVEFCKLARMRKFSGNQWIPDQVGDDFNSKGRIFLHVKMGSHPATALQTIWNEEVSNGARLPRR